MADNWPETRAAFAGLKKAIQNLIYERRIARALNHVVSAIDISITAGRPDLVVSLMPFLRVLEEDTESRPDE